MFATTLSSTSSLISLMTLIGLEFDISLNLICPTQNIYLIKIYYRVDFIVYNIIKNNKNFDINFKNIFFFTPKKIPNQKKTKIIKEQ